MNSNSFKQVGVWIDHSKAHFVGFNDGNTVLIETLESPFESMKREVGEGSDKTRFSSSNEHSSNNEHKKHNISQKELNEYFKMMETKLHSFDDILLFGPGVAKEQMRNRLRENKSFDGKWLSVQTSDKLTEKQLLAFVRDFYVNSNPDFKSV
jgi:hypothetical protein